MSRNTTDEKIGLFMWDWDVKKLKENNERLQKENEELKQEITVLKTEEYDKLKKENAELKQAKEYYEKMSAGWNDLWSKITNSPGPIGFAHDDTYTDCLRKLYDYIETCQPVMLEVKVARVMYTRMNVTHMSSASNARIVAFLTEEAEELYQVRRSLDKRVSELLKHTNGDREQEKKDWEQFSRIHSVKDQLNYMMSAVHKQYQKDVDQLEKLTLEIRKFRSWNAQGFPQVVDVAVTTPRVEVIKKMSENIQFNYRQKNEVVRQIKQRINDYPQVFRDSFTDDYLQNRDWVPLVVDVMSDFISYIEKNCKSEKDEEEEEEEEPAQVTNQEESKLADGIDSFVIANSIKPILDLSRSGTRLEVQNKIIEALRQAHDAETECRTALEKMTNGDNVFENMDRSRFNHRYFQTKNLLAVINEITSEYRWYIKQQTEEIRTDIKRFTDNHTQIFEGKWTHDEMTLFSDADLVFRVLQELTHYIAKNRKDQNSASECVICIDAKATHACVPCGHKCMCENCSKTFMREPEPKCPMCRQEVEQMTKIFGKRFNPFMLELPV